VVLLNDWSARDVQAWESRPLGPHLGKSFATSISAWVTPLDELAGAWIDPPARNPQPLPYLLGKADRGLDLTLDVRLNGERISSPSAADLYWTPAQLVAHLTSGGAPIRPGDLLGSGTISGPRRDQRGCLLEYTWGGRDEFALSDGTTRHYLNDGDEVSIVASAPHPDGGRFSLGEVRGTVTP
jgi:fumarylacetoacetase